MIKVDDHLYDVRISPAGDKLTLTPSSVAVGNVTNPSDSFHAVIYGDRGFLAIQGAKGKPVPVPAGHWKVLSYTITQEDHPKPAKPATAEKAKKAASSDAAWQKQAEAMLKMLTGGPVDVRRDLKLAGGSAVVSANATEHYQAVEVRKGKTVVLPFGAPFKPRVTVAPYMGAGGTTYLEMSLIGSTGEICTNLTVGGRRPAKPEFTITDPKGKVIEDGNFEYG